MDLGLYVVVSDMQASTAFYRELFGVDPYVALPSFVGFSVGGGLFALFSDEAFEHELVRGNNAIPYLRVADIEAEFRRVRELAPEVVHSEIVVEGPLRPFMFSDPDGNKLEFYSVSPPVQ